MPSNQVPASQISQLAEALAANPKLQAQFNALAGITGEEIENPKPKDSVPASTQVTLPASTSADTSAGKVTTDKTDIKDLDPTPKEPVTRSSDILSLFRDFSLPRRVKFATNTYTPNASALFYVLHLMDRTVTKTFRARRAFQDHHPFANNLYFSMLFSIQTLRCMHYCNLITKEKDILTLETFLKSFPPEKLAIPGPLLPYFKAITTYHVQNTQFARVSPSLPEYLISESDITNGNYFGPIFPLVPLAAAIFNTAQEKTIDPKKADAFKFPFPFEKYDSTTKEYSKELDLTFIKISKKPSDWSYTVSWAVNSPSTRFRPVISKETYQSMDDNREDYLTPTLPNQIADLEDWLCLSSMKWFRSFLAPMSRYAALWQGSGSLADCNVDGPSTGAYICRYQNEDKQFDNAPINFFDPNSHFSLSTRVYTRQGSPEAVTELLALATQVHARLATEHPLDTGLSPTLYRSGNVWDIQPEYGPSSVDDTYDSISESILRFLDPKLSS